MKKFPTRHLPLVKMMFAQGRPYAGMTALYMAVLQNEKITERGLWQLWQKYHPEFGNSITLEQYTDMARIILAKFDVPTALPNIYDASRFYIALRLEGALVAIMTDTAVFVKLPRFWEDTEFDFTQAAVRLGWMNGESLNGILHKYVPMDRSILEYSVKNVVLMDCDGLPFNPDKLEVKTEN